MVGGGEILMDGGSRWATVVKWVAGWQSDHDGQWDGGGAMDDTMGGERSPPMQKRLNGRQRELEGRGDHDGGRRCDRDGRRQRRWGTAAQWALGRQSNHNGRWEGGGGMDSTMGGQAPPTIAANTEAAQ